MDEQDLEQQQRLLRQAMDELANNGSITSDTFYRMNQSTSKLGKTIENAEQALDRFWRGPVGKTTKALGGMAKSVGDSAMEARRNREAFSSLNPIVDAAGAALSAIPLVGDSLNKTLVAVGKFVTSELDQSVKAFQNLGSVGGIGAQGVTGLRKSAESAGLSFDQLSQVVSSNSGNLAFAFGGTATGLQQIAKLTQAAEPFRGELLALGLSFQEQSEIFTDYAERQAKLGNLQGRSTADLAASSAAYAKNLTDLSRITGMSVDAAEAEQDAQMSNIRFRKALSGVDEDVAKSISNIGVVIAGIGKDPELTRGFQDLVAGFGTEAATNFTIATGGVGKEVADLLKAGAITEQEAMQRLQGAFQQTYEKLPAQVLGVGTAFDNTALGMANLASAQIDYNKALQQGKDAAKAADPATKQMVEAQLALQRFAVEADNFVNNQVFPNATAIIQKLTNGLADLAGEINNIVGGKKFSTGSTGSMDIPIDFAAADGAYVRKGQLGIVGERGPELFAPKENGTVINAEQAQAIFDTLMGAKTFGMGSTYSKGFLPGVGFVDRNIVGAGEINRLTGFSGERIAEAVKYAGAGFGAMQVTTPGQTFAKGKYQYGDYDMTSGMQSFSGPGSYYDSIMSGVTPSVGTEVTTGLGENRQTVNASTEQLIELQQTMNAALSQIAYNTRTGTDATKKLVRSQS